MKEPAEAEYGDSMRGKDHVCPVNLHKSLDNRLRKLIHNPVKILEPFIKEGDTVIDFGCGPGFFTIPMAELTGETGKTIAADLQQGMLDIVAHKIRNTPFQNRIILHRTERDRINIFVKANFILLFYMIHEVPNARNLLEQLKEIVKPGGNILVVEPPFHVTGKDFERTKEAAVEAGFTVLKGPGMLLSKTAILHS